MRQIHRTPGGKSLSAGWADWRTPVVGLLLGQFVFAALLGLTQTGALQALELLVYDHVLRWQPLTPPDKRIVLIGETEADIQRWGHPLPDSVLAEALERLAQGRPRVIGVDKYRDLPAPPGSERLDQTIRNHPEIVWVMKFGNAAAREPAIAPPAILANSDRIGFSDVPLDEEGLVRRGLLFLDDGRQVVSAFSLIVALRYLQAEGIRLQPDPENPDHLRLGPTTLPPLATDEGGYVHADTAGYQYLLDYRGRLSAKQIYTLTEVLEGRAPAAQFTDKIVLLGSMAVSLRDDFQMPVRHFLMDTPSSTPMSDRPGRIAGVALHALQINQLLRFALAGDAPIRGLSHHVEIAWLWLWCMIGFGLTLCRWRFRWLLALMAGALVALGGMGLLAWSHHVWLPLATPALGLALVAALSGGYRSVHDYVEKRLLMNLLVRHVAPEVADTLWRERERLVAGGRLIPQRLTATVLFADIQGFTTIAETLEPARLMDWLNVYMEAMTQVVMTHEGVIKQYVGDQIMALFGAPVPRQTEAEIASDAMQAVQCALDMGERLQHLNTAWAGQRLPTIAVRIGLCTGPLIAGSLGGRQRIEYAVVGDTVNIASRLESFDKEAHFSAGSACRILISASTFRHVDHRFQVTNVGRIKFKGKQQEITVYRVDGPSLTPDCASAAGACRPDSTLPE
ncbi:MAG TPA: adenylate/guanylate cyclase domain-containing protein [Candidatus Competibacteraceae bacterium]|nr:adenylate/guanylate cyclase domain-containing protein [Candidatus Competibacteraceae bacterium]HRZ05265.1 adenylate/guanylate cyclase domain-containing protein [Candidatus Competibacteraceae bacterium]HSA47695.1 adenylate/guanylate cyclase domain-containing protein [Candidatus Competibacteraceae bacterium]